MKQSEQLLRAYERLVREWAPRLDLVSPNDLERFRERHIDDSLRVAALLGELPEGPCVDIGSGAGLPGIPLAIADPARRWVLLEPRRRRAGFLEEAVRELALDNCEVRALTAEQAAREPQLAGRHVLATARAVAAAGAVRELAEPLLAAGGLTLVFSGRSADAPADAVEWVPGLTIMRKSA